MACQPIPVQIRFASIDEDGAVTRYGVQDQAEATDGDGAGIVDRRAIRSPPDAGADVSRSEYKA